MIDELLKENLAWMNGCAHAFCQNKADAEDLVGDTILKVLLYSVRFDESKSFTAWVRMIMKNTYLNKIRNRWKIVPMTNLPEKTPEYSPEAEACISESMEVVLECAERSIGAKCALLYAQGFSYQEIADMQGVNVNIVKSRIHQGRAIIMRKLKR